MQRRKGNSGGGFLSGMALLFSIAALVLALAAFYRTTTQEDLDAQVRELKGRMEKMKQETLAGMDKVRRETGKALEKVGIAVQRERAPKDEPVVEQTAPTEVPPADQGEGQ